MKYMKKGCTNYPSKYLVVSTNNAKRKYHTKTTVLNSTLTVA